MRIPSRGACLSLGLAGLMAPTTAQTLSGEWGSFVNAGVNANQDKTCISRNIEERRYTLAPDTLNGGFFGVYLHAWHVRWVIKQRPDCAPEGQTPKIAYVTFRTWEIAVSDAQTGGYQAHGKYRSCLGEFCASVSKDNFDAGLSLHDGKLYDQASGSPAAPPLQFGPYTDMVRAATSIASAWLMPWRAALLKDKKEAVAALEFLNPEQYADKQASRTMLRHYYIDQIQNSASFSIVEAYLLDVGPLSWPARPMLFMTVRNDQTSGQARSESYELVLGNDGHWRLFNFAY